MKARLRNRRGGAEQEKIKDGDGVSRGGVERKRKPNQPTQSRTHGKEDWSQTTHSLARAKTHTLEREREGEVALHCTALHCTALTHLLSCSVCEPHSPPLTSPYPRGFLHRSFRLPKHRWHFLVTQSRWGNQRPPSRHQGGFQEDTCGCC